MNHKKQAVVITILLLSFTLTIRAEYRVLHNFAGGANDGSGPMGSLIQSGSMLYGMTPSGGSYGNGIIFRIDANGTGFQLMHSFVSAAIDGQHPFGSLIISDSNLYGMATSEDTGYGGTVFKLGTDGLNFQVLRSFTTSDGVWPYGSLIQSGSTLYGLNTYGGSASGWDGKGTIFKINTDGSNFQKLHTFTGSSSDGFSPHGALLQSGSTLFGMTYRGGSSNNGIVFKINTDNMGFAVLYSFVGGTNDGMWPYGSLIQSGSTLYGMTAQGGINNQGTIFSMNADGTGYQVLHKFAGGSNDGSESYGATTLLLFGSKLYGTTNEGGVNNLGTIFRMDPNGANFELLHSFAGAEGSKPCDSLIVSGLTLYGMTSLGGSNNQGVIFALDIPVTCVNPPTGDLNGDCKVDFQDFAVMANQWLDCGLEPPSAC
jgi:uncharacterized repeat protein (TIGR03803 family)